MIIALREGRGLLTQRNSLRNVNTKTSLHGKQMQIKKCPRPWDVKVKFLHLLLVSPSLADDAIHMEEALERPHCSCKERGPAGQRGSGVGGEHLHYFHYFLMANPQPLLRPPSVRQERQAFFPLHSSQCLQFSRERAIKTTGLAP